MNNESSSQIQRYIRLNELIDDLLDAVDDKKISVNAAVNISYLRKSEQEILNNILGEEKSKLSIAQSEKLKNESENRELDKETISKILNEDKVNLNKKEQKIKKLQSLLAKDFKGHNKDEIKEIFDEILNRHFDKSDNSDPIPQTNSRRSTKWDTRSPFMYPEKHNEK